MMKHTHGFLVAGGLIVLSCMVILTRGIIHLYTSATRLAAMATTQPPEVLSRTFPAQTIRIIAGATTTTHSLPEMTYAPPGIYGS